MRLSIHYLFLKKIKKMAQCFLFILCCVPSIFIAVNSYAANDSTVITEHPKMIPHYIESTNNNPIIKDERYDQLPRCPEKIEQCPDINGSGGNPVTCPDYCTVTRSPEKLIVQNGTKRVDPPVINAVCPYNYAKVATYNVQDEVVYDKSPLPIDPVYGMPAYRRYQEAQYACFFKPPFLRSSVQCNVDYQDGQLVDTLSDAPGVVVFILTTFVPSCYCNSACQGGLSCSCDIPGAKKRSIYYYYPIACKPPAGLYITDNKVPVSNVCARIKTKWHPLQ